MGTEMAFAPRAAGRRDPRLTASVRRARQLVDTVGAGMVLNRNGRRRIILRKAFFDAARVATPVIQVSTNGTTYYVNTRDRIVSRHTFAFGSYEEDLMAAGLAELERRGHPLKGKVFVDVGANIGTSTVPALKRFGAARGLSIEPEPLNYKLLRCNLVANGLDDLVVTVQGAVSDHSGPGTLALSSFNSGDHRVQAGSGDRPEGSPESIDISLYTLDDLLARHGIDPSDIGVVWIDTQGHEGLVFKGALRLLGSGVPVICEYWPYGLRQSENLDLFHELVAANFDTVIDVRKGTAASMRPAPAARVADLVADYPDQTFTDIILLKNP